MTTIAFDGNMLAADSQTTQGDYRLSLHAQKIFQPAVGENWRVMGQRVVAYGVAGTLQGWHYLREALAGFNGLSVNTTFPKGVVVSYLVVTEDGEVYAGGQYENDNVAWLTKVSAPIAVGSGAEFAMGAMAQGATAAQAVEIAARFDVNTGGGVQVLHTVKSPITA